jgi:exodeoxyribonuclease VII small subunit
VTEPAKPKTGRPSNNGDGGPNSAPGTQEDVTTYELARDELAAVVARLESGGLSLDESLVLWERGEHLAAVCTRFLDGARERVEGALARAEQAD